MAFSRRPHHRPGERVGRCGRGKTEGGRGEGGGREGETDKGGGWVKQRKERVSEFGGEAEQGKVKHFRVSE